MRDYLIFYINGQRQEVRSAPVFGSLSDYLRYTKSQTGTKVVCAEGDCGACTVLLGRVRESVVNYRIVNSCTQFLYQLDGAHVVTVEGLRNDASDLTPVQAAMVEHHGSQCGFCTPGFVMSMTALCETIEKPARAEVRDALTGNLCRCTGYLPIITAAQAAAGARYPKVDQRYGDRALMDAMTAAEGEPVKLTDGGREYLKPVSIEQAAEYKSQKPGVMLIAGGTDLGVRMNKGVLEPQVVMSLSGLRGLSEIAESNGAMNIGALTTWTDVENFTRERLPELHRLLILFGSPQIRNSGTIGGNIANASPIADSLPMLYVLEAELELVGTGGTRRVRIDKFYKGYKQLDLAGDELIARVIVPLPKADEPLKLYKVSRRKNMDISSFTAAVLMKSGDGETIEAIRIAYGGVGPVVLRLPKTEAFLAGKHLSEELMREAGELATAEITPISDVRGTKEFRTQLAENILSKFYFDVVGEEETALV